jgi:hypothetical protein
MLATDTEFKQFHDKLMDLNDRRNLVTALDTCYKKYNNNITLDTICYTMSGDLIYYRDNGQPNFNKSNQVTTDINSVIYSLPNSVNIDNDSNRHYTYRIIYDNLLTTNTAGYINYNEYKQDILDLSAGIGMIKQNGLKVDSMNYLVNTHSNIKTKRNNLDMKMRELYENEYNDKQLLYDHSVYFTLAWTVLATSVLYYIFVKL